MIFNQATAAILAALAIETAGEMGVQARPLLMAITIATSLSLITPWGYQTSTLIATDRVDTGLRTSPKSALR